MMLNLTPIIYSHSVSRLICPCSLERYRSCADFPSRLDLCRRVSPLGEVEKETRSPMQNSRIDPHRKGEMTTRDLQVKKLISYLRNLNLLT